MDALKQIEKKHKGTHYPCTEDPCDVVKLARSLDEAARDLVKHGAHAEAEAAIRTLREIAND